MADLLGIGSMIGGLAQAGASIYDTATNKQIADDNLSYQKDVFNQNQQNWRENFDYQKALQERIFDREDTSYQRTVNDMRQAGLNPLTMNGTNGSGEAIATSPLQQEAPQNEYISNTSRMMGDLLATMNGLQNYQIGISYAKEQEAKARSAEAQAQIDEKTMLDKIENSNLDSKTKKEAYKDFVRNMNFNKDLNIFNGMDENSRDARIMQALYDRNSSIDLQNFSTDYLMNKMQLFGKTTFNLFNKRIMEKINENQKRRYKEDSSKNHGASGEW